MSVVVAMYTSRWMMVLIGLVCSRLCFLGSLMLRVKGFRMYCLALTCGNISISSVVAMLSRLSGWTFVVASGLTCFFMREKDGSSSLPMVMMS